MARRERTTALPRRRGREQLHRRRTFLGLAWDESSVRWAILGSASLLLVLVFGILAVNLYRGRWVRPNEVVLSVDGHDVKLRYYSDRLLPFLQQNASSGLSQSLLEQSLLTKLEDEQLTELMAADRGITISDDDIDAAIAEELGVPVGGDGSAFDNLYRQRLKAVAMSDGNYRRLVRADVADARVKEQLKNDLGETSEMITLRSVVLNSEERAKEIQARINAGEDLGTLAQAESLDLTSRQVDGVMQPEPAKLLPESIRTAVEGKAEGTLLGPIQVDTNWWVFRVEKRDPAAVLTDAQKTQLVQLEFDRLLAEKRAAVRIERNLDAGDVRWARDHAN